ncbi:Glycoside hydrolase, superfamily [Phaffia rhodozyma]|uniref:Glycoside hydrolase, superfamily n=1 Tax=Phaffia rhodozyma TaxID=264483 RepID=A0A0F7SE43_PHARH|nr:Glycoside hydrolase, superfamily [Phaffia rhodozyma]
MPIFAKLSNKVRSLVDDSKPPGSSFPGTGVNSQQQQQSFSQPGSEAGGRIPIGNGSKSEIMRYRFWAGVNLGSWFTLEKWISSSPFEGAAPPGGSDLDICKSGRPKEEIKRKLEQHWDTWIVESDFEFLAQRGINSIRLPISYYHLSGLDPSLVKDTEFDFTVEIYQGAWSRITRAFEWANRYHIGVLVDLHAVPGKQNPDAHAGASHEALLFTHQKYQAQTVRTLEVLLRAIAGVENVIGLELMNEPAACPQLQKFHLNTLNRLRSICGPDFPLMISDAWQLEAGLKIYFPTSSFILLDTHVYRCFTSDDCAKSAERHAEEVRGDLSGRLGTDLVQKSESGGGRVIVGEWSGALNPGSLNGSQGGEQDAKRRNFVRAQLEVFEGKTSGYFFWTYRKQDGWDAGWSFKDACRAEIIPVFLGPKHKGNVQISPDLLSQRRQFATNAHSQYWDKAVRRPMEHDRFQSGYTTGWEDALHFLSSGTVYGNGPAAEIPAAGGQWKVRRFEEHIAQRGSGEFAWEWGHGFDQGRQAATEAWKTSSLLS